MTRIAAPALAMLALALFGFGPARAQPPARIQPPEQVLNFVSGPDAGQWDRTECPSFRPKLPADSRRYPSQPPSKRVPPANELGALAQTVIREQPVLDPQEIPGLTLQSLAQPRRIAVWGDSHIAAGPFIPTLLRTLRANGLTVGTRYLPPTMGRANVRLAQLHAYCIGPGWDTELSYASTTPTISGPALANRVAQAGPDSYLWLDLRDASDRPTLREVRIVYHASAGSALELSVNGSATSDVALNTNGDGTTPSQTLTLRSDAPISTLKLQVTQGRFTLYGFILDDTNPPALSFDVFGIPSATVRGWANADPAYIQQALHGVSYDGVILEYGTNEGNTLSFDHDKYVALLTQALTNMRQIFPSASCVLVGPPDRGVLEEHGSRGDLLGFSRTHQQIAATQREIGKRFGCVAWNWQDLMGGPGGSYGWFYAAPSLMGHDLTHLSPAGYKQTGQALAHSLGWK
ncbi:MAG: hypothetical protein LBV61_09260 [Burkholderiaceae bacterium]|jgi:lysophospholipase L1-like esterase|nr:hypothetical protein [Burkholderiaceae bacterium]